MNFHFCILILLTTVVGSTFGESQSGLNTIEPTLWPEVTYKSFSGRNELSEDSDNLLSPFLDQKMNSLEVAEIEMKVLNERRKTKKQTSAKNKQMVERQEEYHGKKKKGKFGKNTKLVERQEEFHGHGK